MTTDVKVQFFSHLNGLNLGNNWGDLIRLLDAALVNGVSLPIITAASIDEQGDVHLTFNADHKALLFQVVELLGFTPESLNQKYRIKGVPSATSLILKPETALFDTMISNSGAAKIASLGYEIVFRDVNDVKRVYRAKNPSAQHPFIRVDETIGSLEGSYTETYAKYAMVGLLENMAHIDDYVNPDVLQLPFDPNDPSKNWKITGTGATVVRGWMRWHYAAQLDIEASQPANGNRKFTIVGDSDAFYLQVAFDPNNPVFSYLYGLGLFNHCQPNEVIPNWFLMGYLTTLNASSTQLGNARVNVVGSTPIMSNERASNFITTKYTPIQKITSHSVAMPLLPNHDSGNNTMMSNSNHPALEIPFYTDNAMLLGTLKHVAWVGKNLKPNQATPMLVQNSMYVNFPVISASNPAGLTAYIGELDYAL